MKQNHISYYIFVFLTELFKIILSFFIFSYTDPGLSDVILVNVDVNVVVNFGVVDETSPFVTSL